MLAGAVMDGSADFAGIQCPDPIGAYQALVPGQCGDFSTHPHTGSDVSSDTAKVFTKMSSEEIRLANMWYKEDDMEPKEIAELLHRDKSTVTRHLFHKHIGKQGPKPYFTGAEITWLVKETKGLIKKANGRSRVTAAVIKKKLKLEASTWTILRALHSKGVYFRKNREKPVLSTEDIESRKNFARKYRGKPKRWWLKSVHAHIDCKFFKTYLNGKMRLHAAKERYWGAFRGRADGDGLRAPYVRPRKDQKTNTGSRGIMVLAGVGKGKMLLFEFLDKKRWNSKTAVSMYTGPVVKSLRKAYPRRKRFSVLEDNDPSGFKTKGAERAKKAVGIKPFVIPKRSPQLNVMDYAIWSEINRRLRNQERGWPSDRKETRKEYLARLRRTAMRLPPKFINASIQSMRTRCQRLHRAKGDHIEEGKMKA